MKVEGTRTFAARRETVWEVLNDPGRMAQTMPGVESFDVIDDDHWKANVKIPLGLGGLRMSIDFTKTDQRPPEHARLHAKGNGVGAMMNMETAFDLAEEGDGTSMRWQADVRIAGPVGSMGQRVLQPIVNQQVLAVLNALDLQVQEAKHAGAAGGGGSGGAAFYEGPQPTTADPLAAGASDPGVGETGASHGPATGRSGTPPPSTEPPPPRTDPELKDVGPPAQVSPSADSTEQAGSSGAEQGLGPMSPDAYTADPQPPDTSTEDRG